MKITIIIPCFNESKYIEEVISEVNLQEINDKQKQLDSVKAKHKIEKEKFEQTKVNVKSYKDEVVREVAQIKLKNKLKTITAAGLADALHK